MAHALGQTQNGVASELEYPVTDLDQPIGNSKGSRYEAAELGFRHYWYPALLSRQLGKKPKSIMLLGEHLVFVRANNRAYALLDRCAHRGMPLSEGKCWNEGQITCPYHGWTYNLHDGELIAALTDGPDSAVVGKKGKGVRSYP
ncbi:MAG TPA: Rieske 2Fe-2S domain-containing protein, partial [Candidatus Binatia bacterium]